MSDTEDTIVSEIDLAAPPERVFQALIDPQQVPKWWGQKGVYQCKSFSADVRVGGKWRNAGVGPDGRDFEISGEYLEVEPPHRLVTSWVATWTGDAQTTVAWELAATAKGTRLTIRHSGLASHPGLAQSYRGWPRMLGWLRAFVENGETVESRPAQTWS